MKNLFYFCAGLVFLVLAKTKYHLMGYLRPVAFQKTDAQMSAQHARDIVQNWKQKCALFGAPEAWKGVAVLEVGVGHNLGTGVLLLLDGAKSYEAFDCFRLVSDSAKVVYDELVKSHRVSNNALAEAAVDARGDQIRYTVDSDFKPDVALSGRAYDLIVSNAAFEHFAEVEDTLSRLTKLAKPGAILCLEVDFQTHSRWIRDADPNNIYRYPSWLYDGLLGFRSQPNRVRPDQYADTLHRNGWRDIAFYPGATATPDYLAWSTRALQKKFQRPESRIETLNGVLMARR